MVIKGGAQRGVVIKGGAQRGVVIKGGAQRCGHKGWSTEV